MRIHKNCGGEIETDYTFDEEVDDEVSFSYCLECNECPLDDDEIEEIDDEYDDDEYDRGIA